MTLGDHFGTDDAEVLEKFDTALRTGDTTIDAAKSICTAFDIDFDNLSPEAKHALTLLTNATIAYMKQTPTPGPRAP